MDSLLISCDDQESDVRLVAGESLNKLIKGVMDTSLGRIHVELYKEIKKVREGFSAVFRGKTEQIFHVSCIPCGF